MRERQIMMLRKTDHTKKRKVHSIFIEKWDIVMLGLLINIPKHD